MNFVLPSSGVNWTTSGPNSIIWTYKEGDPTFVNLQLLHNGNGNFEPIANLLTADGILVTGIDITSQMMFLSPSCMPGRPSLPTGSGYSLRMFYEQTNGSRTTMGITNGTFNIITGEATECLTYANGTFTTSAISVPTSNATVSANSSSSPRNRAGAIAGGIIGGLIACLLIAAFTVRHRRNMRKRMTQHFIMKKGLILPKLIGSKNMEIK